MNIEQIFESIKSERRAQDAVWTDRAQYKRSAAHILVLQGEMKKLEGEWYSSKLDALLNRFKKIAAIAIRALEEIEPKT